MQVIRPVAALALLCTAAAGAQSAAFNAPRPVEGYAVADSIALRRAPRPDSPIVARIPGVDPNAPDAPFEVASVSGGYVRLRKGDRGGWASLRDAVPRSVAIVVDARTGATLARLPVGHGQHDVAFSPDGTRFVVYGRTDPGGAAHEYSSTDLLPMRSIVSTGADGKVAAVRAVFYGGPDRALYAVVEEPEALSIVRVHAGTGPEAAPVYHGPGTDFAASPDGRVGFVLREIERDADLRTLQATVDVWDLVALEKRSTIRLTGALARAFVELEPSADGSELVLLGDVSRVIAVSTATGSVVREVATGWAADPELSLQTLATGGRALLIVATGNFCEHNIPEGSWWLARERKGPMLGNAQVPVCAVDAGAARYEVRSDGWGLYRSTAARGPARVAALRGVEPLAPSQQAWPTALVASPDGRRLFFFVSYSEPFCPC